MHAVVNKMINLDKRYRPDGGETIRTYGTGGGVNKIVQDPGREAMLGDGHSPRKLVAVLSLSARNFA